MIFRCQLLLVFSVNKFTRLTRVNRVYEGKDRGLIVDYIGIKKNMNIALRKYTNFEKQEFDNIEQAVTIVLDEIDGLDSISTQMISIMETLCSN